MRPLWLSRLIAGVGYLLLILLWTVLAHIAVWWVPWTTPPRPVPWAFDRTMIALLFGAQAMMVVTGYMGIVGLRVMQAKTALPPPTERYEVAVMFARRPAGAAVIGGGRLVLLLADKERVIPLDQIVRVEVRLSVDRLLGVFVLAKRYPVTLRLRNGKKLGLFVFAARAFAEAIEMARLKTDDSAVNR